MNDLIAFLKAQFDAEEQVAQAALKGWRTMPFGRSSETGIYAEALLHAALYGPVRVLREIEAKRWIIELHQEESDTDECRHDLQEFPCPTLRCLALPYADHESYREEWKP